MSFDFKATTPDTSVTDDDSGVFGADSQTASTPSWYSFGTIKAWIKSWITPSGPGYTSGRRYFFAGQIGSSLTGAPLTAGRIYLKPVYIPVATTIASISANLKIAVASSNVQFAIYAQDPMVLHRPGALLGSTGSASSATASSNIEIALSANAVLAPGWYFVGVNSDITGVAFSAASTATWGDNLYMGADSLAGLFSASTNSHLVNVYTASTFGTWPSSLHGATFVESIGSTLAPVFGFLTA